MSASASSLTEEGSLEVVLEPVHVSNRGITIQSVFQCAVLGASVSVDPAILRKADELRTAHNIPSVGLSRDDALGFLSVLSTDQLNERDQDTKSIEIPNAVVRATLLVRLAQAAQLKWTTPCSAMSIQLIASLLNNDILPRCHVFLTHGVDDSLVSRIILTRALLLSSDICETNLDKSCNGSSFSLLQSARACGIQPPWEWSVPMTSAEFEMWTQGPAASGSVAFGAAALLTAQMESLTGILDCDIALSMETLCSPGIVLDSSLHENSRAHKGSLETVSNVRALLESSRRIKAKSKSSSQDASSSQISDFDSQICSCAMASIDLNGSFRDLSRELRNTVAVELKGSESYSKSDGIEIFPGSRLQHLGLSAIFACRDQCSISITRLQYLIAMFGGYYDPERDFLGSVLPDVSLHNANRSFRHVQHLAQCAQNLLLEDESAISSDRIETLQLLSMSTDTSIKGLSFFERMRSSLPIHSSSVLLLALSSCAEMRSVYSSEICCAIQALHMEEQRMRCQYASSKAKKAEARDASGSFGIEKLDISSSSDSNSEVVAPNVSASVQPSKKENDKKKKKKEKASETAPRIVRLQIGSGTRVYRSGLSSRLGLEELGPDGQDSGIGIGSNEDEIQLVLQRFHCSRDPASVSFTELIQQSLQAGISSSSLSSTKVKIPKGTRDFTPSQMAVREKAFGIITNVFKRHGAITIDTPVFELRETLMGKYGEDSKLIYDLADQGGELLSLRYDLTVPFARFVAAHGVGSIKRYHIARVYRRDNPAIEAGRYREFYQCDFDIAGAYQAPMITDAEVIKVIVDVLDALQLGDYSIKVNHRCLLDAIMSICGVPEVKFRTICSSIDKLDKSPWDDVCNEMVFEKGLDAVVAGRIRRFVELSGDPLRLLSLLRGAASGEDESSIDPELNELLVVLRSHPDSQRALSDLDLLFGYLCAMEPAINRVSFDLSLARGLDYYTGVIFEAVVTKKGVRVGSIAAGGRYDHLVGMFAGPGREIPAVGCSIGIERVFTLLEQLEKEGEIAPTRTSPSLVFVASIGSQLLEHRVRIASTLWQSGISAEFMYHDSPNIKKQMSQALELGVPFMVIFGEDEISNGIVKVKNISTHEEEEIKVSDVASYISSKLV